MTASDAGNEFGEEGLQPDERERLVEKASAIHRDVDWREHRVEPEEHEAFAVETTIGPSSAPRRAEPNPGPRADESSTQERSIPT